MLGLFLKEEVFFYTKSYLLDFSMLATHQRSIWIPSYYTEAKKKKIKSRAQPIYFQVLDLIEITPLAPLGTLFWTYI